MAISIRQYVEPGVFIQNEAIQTIPGFVALPRQLCLIGEGDPCKTVVDEQIVRGYIEEELISPSTAGVFTTAKTGDWKKSSMFLFKDGDQQAADTWVLSAPAALTAALGGAGTVDAGTHSYRVTFVIGGVETQAGAVSNVVTTSGAEEINLTNVPLGPAGTTARLIYRTAAGQSQHKLVPGLSVSFADNTTTSGTDNEADSSLTTNAPETGIIVGTISAAAFDPAGVYSFSYQSLVADNDFDPLEEDVRNVCGALTRVGQFPGSSNFVEDVDVSIRHDATGTITATGTAVTGVGTAFDTELALGDVIIAQSQVRTITAIASATALTINSAFTPDISIGVAFKYSNGSLKWLAPTAGSITGANGETFDMTANGGLPHTFKVTIDGGIQQTVTLVTADFAVDTAATAAEVQTALSAGLTGEVVSTSAGKIVVASASTGSTSTISIGDGTANTILGFTEGAFNRGGGKNPAQGEQYFISYKAKRPDDEFNRPILSTDFDSFQQKVGSPSSTNALALAGQIVFEQNPPFIFHIQVKNTGTGAAAQVIDYTDAIKGAELNEDITDIVVLGFPGLTNTGGTNPQVRDALRDHVIDQSSLLARAERLGWFGLSSTAVPGDGETQGTFVYVATNDLQVSADSPGRGRFILTAPAFLKKTYRFVDGTVKQLTLDGTYLAAGLCALNASFLSPSEGLLRKAVVGLDEVQELTKADRDLMAQNGVTVIVDRNGQDIVFDPVTTHISSAEFREINVMNQKDVTVKRVRRSVDDSIVGLVPDDLAQFIFELKSVIATQLNSLVADGDIAPYQNDDGSVRNIDLRNDIVVKRRSSDPTTFDFTFQFFTKFIVKRLFGTFSVRVPSGV